MIRNLSTCWKFYFLHHIFTLWPEEFLSFTPGVLASCSRRHLKSYSQQMPLEDMQTISKLFADPMISEGFGRYLLPEVVYPCGLRFPTDSPLPSGAALGSLSSTALRYLGSEGVVCQKSRGKSFFQRNLCYHVVGERIWLQEQKLWGIFPGQRGLKNHF